MCGIAGIISDQPFDAKAIIQRMTDAIAHRGPDGQGHWTNASGHITLGHRRLKVIDLSEAAHQPMHFGRHEDAHRYTITYNGEIYNYLELRDTLRSAGYDFLSQSDTEVILAAYDHWRSDCVQHFDGMFAFAIWDEAERTLFAARDRFGEKPFYYHFDRHRFLFASEMKALWAAGIEKKARPERLLTYLGTGMLQQVTAPDSTFFDQLYNLPPAHHLTLRFPSMEMQVSRYWDLDKETVDETITATAATERFMAMLQASVAKRLRSDVAIGTSLSGGLDSSSIVALCSQLSQGNAKQRTFSAVFPGFEKDESSYIDAVIRHCGVQGERVTPTASSLAADWDALVRHQEEPFQSLSIYAQYKVYALAAQHGVTVLLDGQGADETMAGYHRYYHWYWQELAATGKQRMKRQEMTAARQLGVTDPWSFRNEIAARLPGLTAKKLEQKAKKAILSNPDLDPSFIHAHLDPDALYKPVVRKLNDILYFNTCGSGLQELLRYADRNSMAHGREVRCPFLDHALVQFVFSLPSHFKIRDGWSKWVLRQAMNGHLPDAIVHRKDKIGYEPPQQQWMQDKVMQERIMESRRQLVREGILRPDVIDKPVAASAAHEDGNADMRYLCVAAIV